MTVDRYVSDDGPGTPELFLTTIAKTAELARAGDTVVVKPSLYREQVRLVNSSNPTAPITFAGREYDVYSISNLPLTIIVNLSAVAGKALSCRFYKPSNG